MKVGFVGRSAALVAVGALALAGCGGASGTAEESPSPAGSEPAVTVDETLAALVPEKIKSSGTLNLGTDASYAPSEFLAEDGSTIVGFDIDLGEAIGAKLGLDTNFTNGTFDSLIVGVQQGKFDGAMSSFTINPDRLKQVNMISYFDAGTSWAAQTGNPSGISVEDPCGKTVAVQKATVQVPDLEKRSKDCEAASKPAIDIQQYTLQSEATTAVVSGKADAMLADSPVVAYAIQQAGSLEAIGEVYDSAPYGVIVPKDETQFADAIRGAIDALIADGTYAAILDEWGVANGAVTQSEVNPAVG